MSLRALHEEPHGVTFHRAATLDAQCVLGHSDKHAALRGVVLADGGRQAWADRPTGLRPPLDIEGPHDYLTEIHPQGEAFVRTLTERLVRGATFFIDYGFPEAEYYHPQRHMGTLICHRAHRSDSDPLSDVGEKDITAHVNFTGIALAAQDAGLLAQKAFKICSITCRH